jgi:hypothetical protein
MLRTFGRRTRLAAFGTGLAGVATAAVLVLSGSAPALADTQDTGGTATIAFSTGYLEHLTKGGILVLADAPASASWSAGFNNVTFTVTGGNGEVNNFFGAVKIGGGKLRLVNAANGKHVTLAGLSFSFDHGYLTAKPVGSTTRIIVADIGGDLSEGETGTPPNVNETFACDQFLVDASGAAFLNKALGTKAFKAGDDIGGFSTAFTGVQS